MNEHKKKLVKYDEMKPHLHIILSIDSFSIFYYLLFIYIFFGSAGFAAVVFMADAERARRKNGRGFHRSLLFHILVYSGIVY